MEIVYIQEGFQIKHRGRVLFEQTFSPTGGPWDQAEREALANKMFQTYFENYLRKPLYKKIEREYEDQFKKPFTDSRGITWSGEKNKASALRDLVELEAAIGNTSNIVFVDIADQSHTFTRDEAMQVVAELGLRVKNLFMKKIQLRQQVKQAATEEEIQAIKIDFNGV